MQQGKATTPEQQAATQDVAKAEQAAQQGDESTYHATTSEKRRTMGRGLRPKGRHGCAHRVLEKDNCWNMKKNCITMRPILTPTSPSPYQPAAALGESIGVVRE